MSRTTTNFPPLRASIQGTSFKGTQYIDSFLCVCGFDQSSKLANVTTVMPICLCLRFPTNLLLASDIHSLVENEWMKLFPSSFCFQTNKSANSRTTHHIHIVLYRTVLFIQKGTSLTTQVEEETGAIWVTKNSVHYSDPIPIHCHPKPLTSQASFLFEFKSLDFSASFHLPITLESRSISKNNNKNNNHGQHVS